MKIRFNPHSNGSKGLKALKNELTLMGHDVKELKKRNSNYTHHPSTLLINWGCPGDNRFSSALNFNAHNASNKLLAFQLMVRNGLKWSTDIEEAKTWIRREGHLVYCRTLLSASQGRGIVVAKNNDEIVPAPLYTKGINQVEGEYRVHVFKGQVIDYVKKMRMNSSRIEAEEITHNPLIRNHANGYIFGRNGVLVCPEVSRVAIEAVEDLQLDFGAVDVVKSSYSGKGFVLEVNTAPGLEGSTVTSYANAIVSGC
jgi:hypothetical protein